MIQIARLVQSRFAWAALSTAAASASTVVYLFTIYQKSDSADFIHLYSVITMLAGWLYGLLFFLPGYYPAIIKRHFTFAIFLGAVWASLLAAHFIFGNSIGWPEVSFAAALLSPSLLVPGLGLLFRDGKFQEAYSITIALNLCFLVAALIAALHDSTEYIYLYTGACLPIGLMIWFSHPAFRKNYGKFDTALTLTRGVFNPSLPVLERTLWDQFLLLHFGRVEFTFWLYLFSRLVSFAGTVSYSYFTQGALERVASAKFNQIAAIGLIFIAGIHVFFPFYFSLETSLIVGQAAGWIFANALLLSYEKADRSYFIIFAIWLFDFLLRALFFLKGDQSSYAAISMSSAALAGCFVYWVFWRTSRIP